MSKKEAENRPGMKLIFRMFYRHPKTGKLIRSKRPMPMWVKA